MSFFEQASLDIGENAVLISLSVLSSVHCCIVISGSGEPARTTFISHRPALRIGNSSAAARPVGDNASRQQDVKASDSNRWIIISVFASREGRIPDWSGPSRC